MQVVNSKVKLIFCKLCLTEKYYIINALENPSLLNKRSEFVNNCQYKCKLLLNIITDNKDYLF